MTKFRQVTNDTGVYLADDDETILTVIRNGKTIYVEVRSGTGPDDNGRPAPDGVEQ